MQDKIAQLKQKKFDDKIDKIINGIEVILGFAADVLTIASLIAPQFRLGAIILNIIQNSLEVVGDFAKIARSLQIAAGSSMAEYDLINRFLCDGINNDLDKTFKYITIMSCWSKKLAKFSSNKIVNYAVSDTNKPPYSKYEVPADLILDQIYRFRCIMDPGKQQRDAATLAMLRKNVALIGMYNAYGVPR